MDERANQILLFESQFVVKEIREIKEDKLGGKLKILATCVLFKDVLSSSSMPNITIQNLGQEEK